MGQMAPQADSGSNSGQMAASSTGKNLLQGGLGAIGPSLQNYFQQKTQMANAGGAPMPAMPGAQPVDPSYFAPRKLQGNNLNFYGGE